MGEDASITDKGVAMKSTMNSNLNRGLKGRHMSMIALGGAIGTGLFMGSAGGLASAGPAGLLVAYVITGSLVFFVLCGLAEMAAYMPITGSFAAYCERFVDPALGFAIGWTYWFSWTVAAGAEFVATGILVSYWLPGTPQYIWGIISAAIVFGLNIFHVKGFGEAEFWFALIKVIMIIAFIIVGICVVCGWLGGVKYGFTNWKINGTPFVDGAKGTIFSFVFAIYSFLGSETIGLTAGESRNPRKDVPAAVFSLFYRIVLFYIISIFIMGLIIPSNDPTLSTLGLANVKVAPFTQVFVKAKIPAADHIVNAVVLTSVLSACNAAMYATSRMIYSLYHNNQAPRFLAITSKNGVPYIALILSVFLGLMFVLLAALVENAYLFLVNVGGVIGMFSWIATAIVHIFFRRAYTLQGFDIKSLPYRAPLYPFGPYFALLTLGVVLGGQIYVVSTSTQKPIEKVSTLIGIPLFVLLYVVYKIVKKTKIVKSMDVDLVTDSTNLIDYTTDTVV
ncbi:Lysine-specific permease [Zancudomyces culisetae]|uniref:Lysine-specific permease n=1 Tax=Zancudomyces culisetae TaxID=1213189 RepID=A0A1R1PT88_ZANCU|nr:Lysine-specific permease [Zancudomyces culisetae]|eukprot:OMH84102.1 Lysine-specific permease [Zancudomyces culisetae]